MNLIFATNNRHKVEEIKALLPQGIEIITMKEAGIDIDIPEPFETLEENAIEKCSVIHKITSGNCFSEDTGLEVEALNGVPGVKSARYAGEGRNAQDNINKLIHNLQENANRNARFRTVIALIWNNEKHLFEGVCNGRIIEKQTGADGFGYDPIFIPDGSEKTFAQMTMEEKNTFSHRAKATAKLIEFLKNNY